MGIGTTNLLNKLVVAYADSTTAVANPAVLRLLNTDTTVNNQTNIKFSTNDSNAAAVSTAVIGSINTVHTAGIVTGDLFFATNNASFPEEKMRILANGNVGIGTTSPTAKLHVAGDGKLTGNLTVDGNIAAKYQDVAEWVPASEQILAGTVVVLDSTKSNHVIPSTKGYDTLVAGVISAQPGIALGESGNGRVLVATTGRVRIKVDASQGPIHIGDLLVTSDKAGMAMKSEAIKVGRRLMHLPGTLIGKALEPLEKGSGTILVLLSLQ